jgi:4-amino-4-deoxy-L-arabinose transferase-like glycosyltransferase
MKFNFINSQRKFVSAIILATIFIRVTTLGAYALADRTESRYGEIARKMAETGDWITPQIDYGVPFWGKPPLSTWLTAISLKIFGINEFAARFSSFFLIVFTVVLIYILVRKRGLNYALISTMILVTTLGFFVSSGAVMTDPALVLGTTMSMVGFWQALQSTTYSNRWWGYLFFVGLAIGLLAKGPVCLVLTFFPILIWTLWQKKISHIWQSIPWLSGTVLMLCISLPWYLLAEAKTPGFLNYFIVGEHWKRFTESGWEGDLYGSGHAHPYGTIWLYWLLSAFPWSLAFIILFIKSFFNRSSLNVVSQKRELFAYLFLWAITPMVFFTFAGNILWTYVLPGLPAFAILLTELLLLSSSKQKMSKQMISIGLIIPLLFLFAFPIVINVANKNSQKYIVNEYQSLCSKPNCQLVYLFDVPYSAEFYSLGKVKQVELEQAILLLEDENQDYFVARSKKINFSETLMSRLEKVKQYGRYTLFRELVR